MDLPPRQIDDFLYKTQALKIELMARPGDSGRIGLCGEESFGTGSDHVREKDGVWAALAWLQILATKKWTVEQTLKDFWGIYGRNFFTRYDYEDCDSGPCNEMMAGLQSYVEDKSNVGRSYQSSGKTFIVSAADNFSYTDPVDGSVTTKQVWSLLQFFSVDFSLSMISVRKCVFNKRAIKVSCFWSVS